MIATDPEPVPWGRPRCAHCGDVIGVYERLVLVAGERAEQTSRAAQPSLSDGAPGLLFHAACYGPLQGSATP